MADDSKRDSFYEYDLDVNLLSMLDAYEDTRNAYWQDRLDSEEWSHVVELQRTADDVARVVMAQAEHLAHPDASDAAKDFGQIVEEYKTRQEAHWRTYLKTLRLNPTPELLREYRQRWTTEAFDERAEKDAPLRLVWERLVVDLAREALEERLLPAARRVLQLMELAIEAAPGEPTNMFLRHVSRCYVWGFDAECVMLCRGAIDTAFRDAVPDELCASRRNPSRNGYGLQDRIETAFPDLIDRNTYDAARRVKERGDKAVHYDPEACTDSRGTIRDTMRVIGSLSKDLPD